MRRRLLFRQRSQQLASALAQTQASQPVANPPTAQVQIPLIRTLLPTLPRAHHRPFQTLPLSPPPRDSTCPNDLAPISQPLLAAHPASDALPHQHHLFFRD